MRTLSSLALTLALAVPTLADAHPRRAPLPPAPPVAPLPPAPAIAPLPPMPPLAPLPPIDAFAIAPPAHAMPPGTSFSFSFGKGRLGVHVSSMTPELRRFFGAPEDSGLLVQGVETDTPAGKAGVNVGDVIVRVDGDAIDDVGDVGEALSDRSSGDVVDIVVIRGKKRRELKAEMRDDAGAGFGPGPGIRVFGGDDELREELDDLRQRLQSLEEQLGKSKPKKKSVPPGVRPKKKAPKSDPKKT
ncbi:MAG TPA: PDZ domain-containing protein [Nannocystaceae bacterium]|nr:PDZ domain-containing protein [Nannocystaceae bacterium]